MEDEQEKMVGTSRRRSQRICFTFQVVLELLDGPVMRGATRDVSSRGIFMTTSGGVEGIRVGQSGMLRLTVLNLKREFSCRVVHVQSNGIGLTILDPHESFGTIWQGCAEDVMPHS
ncbi:MAG: PilZ domain-containing protein [Magnetococcales bacterium]|nr:PilZ domain-containing protein [Magnetococcales bacterium]NGZ04953.1 PilZ domain-containing protein [Magnetococcales bacterium]